MGARFRLEGLSQVILVLQFKVIQVFQVFFQGDLDVGPVLAALNQFLNHVLGKAGQGALSKF